MCTEPGGLQGRGGRGGVRADPARGPSRPGWPTESLAVWSVRHGRSPRGRRPCTGHKGQLCRGRTAPLCPCRCVASRSTQPQCAREQATEGAQEPSQPRQARASTALRPAPGVQRGQHGSAEGLGPAASARDGKASGMTRSRATTSRLRSESRMSQQHRMPVRRVWRGYRQQSMAGPSTQTWSMNRRCQKLWTGTQTAIPSGGGDHVALDRACAPAVLTSQGPGLAETLRSQSTLSGHLQVLKERASRIPGPSLSPLWSSIRAIFSAFITSWCGPASTPSSLLDPCGLWTCLFPSLSFSLPTWKSS